MKSRQYLYRIIRDDRKVITYFEDEAEARSLASDGYQLQVFDVTTMTWTTEKEAQE